MAHYLHYTRINQLNWHTLFVIVVRFMFALAQKLRACYNGLIWTNMAQFVSQNGLI